MHASEPAVLVLLGVFPPAAQDPGYFAIDEYTEPLPSPVVAQHGHCAGCPRAGNQRRRQRRWDRRQHANHDTLSHGESQIVLWRAAALDEADRDPKGDADRNRRCPPNTASDYRPTEEH